MSLRQHELKNLFSNVILVDKFRPKIGKDENIIVIAFKCIQQMPTKDLEQFIQNGPYDILDVEIIHEAVLCNVPIFIIDA